MTAVSDLALDPSIRLNKQLEQLLHLMKIFSYKKNIVDNQQLVNIITAIENTLKQTKSSKTDSDHCRGLLLKAFSLIQMPRHTVDSVTFLDNISSSNVVSIRPVSIDFVDASFERILEASDALNPAYAGSHFSENLEAYLTEPDPTITNQESKRRHLSLVPSNKPCSNSNGSSNSKPNNNYKKGK